MVKHNRGCDPEQPAEYGGGEDDPDERCLGRSDGPAQLDGSRVRRDENDEYGEQRDQDTCSEVQADAARVS